jgi:hypothetical protein
MYWLPPTTSQRRRSTLNCADSCNLPLYGPCVLYLPCLKTQPTCLLAHAPVRCQNHVSSIHSVKCDTACMQVRSCTL